jgi:hypothetical protein
MFDATSSDLGMGWDSYPEESAFDIPQSATLMSDLRLDIHHAPSDIATTSPSLPQWQVPDLPPLAKRLRRSSDDTINWTAMNA